MSMTEVQRNEIIDSGSPIGRLSLSQKMLRKVRTNNREDEERFSRRGPGNKIRFRREWKARSPEIEEIVLERDFVCFARDGGSFEAFRVEIGRNNSVNLVPLNDSI